MGKIKPKRNILGQVITEVQHCTSIATHTHEPQSQVSVNRKEEKKK